MRIAVGGIHIECSTYNPVLNEEKDFRVTRDSALLAAPYFRFLQDYPATFLPTIHARAIAGGPVSRATYEKFKGELIAGLEAQKPFDGLYLPMHGAMYVEGMEDAEGDWIAAAREVVGPDCPILIGGLEAQKPFDGLYLPMHGAMYVEGMEDAEGDWIAAAREVVGPDCPISVSYDLHGNVSQKIIDAIDMFSTYRTAPHIDTEETMRRSVAMLIKTLQTGVKPTLLWVPVPVVLPGERTSTEDEPAKTLYARLPVMDEVDGVWDSSLMVGYVWADEPRATAAVIMTGTDQAVLEREANQLAD